MRFILAMAEYYHQRYLGKTGEKYWIELEKTADKLNEYWVPVTYESTTPGVQILDALSRTQQRHALTRCRGARLNEMKKKERLRQPKEL